MAWYYGKFICGHEGRVNVIGPAKDRQWKIDKRFENLCEECYLAKLESDRLSANKLALELATEMELPELQGSDKQIAWANTIRQGFIDSTDKFVEKIKATTKWEYYKEGYKEFKNIEIDDLKIILDYLLVNETSAKFYIDNRSNSVNSILAANVKKAIITDNDRINNVIEEEIIKEGTISPLEVNFSGIVEIKATKNKIEVVYVKDDKFREIVKSLGYKWTGIWEKDITETTGSYIDRAAELGNKLLNEGFTVSILEEEIRRKSILGDFEAECTRWIYARKGTNKLAITWNERNDNIYNASRKLPGSKWESPSTLVDISIFNEVEEFSEMYGFKFTNAALNLVNKYKEELSNIEKVIPTSIKEAPSNDGLNDILNSSTAVLADLLED